MIILVSSIPHRGSALSLLSEQLVKRFWQIIGALEKRIREEAVDYPFCLDATFDMEQLTKRGD